MDAHVRHVRDAQLSHVDMGFWGNHADMILTRSATDGAASC
jgi:hypothetical protein